jgi:hypothetical protein
MQLHHSALLNVAVWSTAGKYLFIELGVALVKPTSAHSTCTAKGVCVLVIMPWFIGSVRIYHCGQLWKTTVVLF